MAKLVIILLLPVIVGVSLFFAFQQPERIPLNHFLNITSERYWGDGDRPSKIDESIRPFKIDVPDSVLEDLKFRLKNTRYFSPIEGSPVDYGTSPAFTKDLVQYWLNSYDWRKQEKLLNQHPQFITNIDGIEIHFVHVKAKNLNNDLNFNPKPLLIVHGWPGSFFEFQEIIPILTDPANHGANGSVAYDVVAPSIPGYGFSSSAKKRGMETAEVGLLFAKLMKRLGYQKYIAQGGDWGALIVNAVAGLNPENCAGVHLNAGFPRVTPLDLIKYLASSIIPASYLYSTDTSSMTVFPISKFIGKMLVEMGYLHLQATRPYTLGESLTDSPAGLAAYISEKFYAWSDCHGDVFNSFTKDQLLTNIMIYWVSNSITSSITFYKENFSDSKLSSAVENAPINIPTAFIEFPRETLVVPQAWIASKFVNLISYTKAPKGGHFAAMEEPEILAEDLWRFHQLVPF